MFKKMRKLIFFTLLYLYSSLKLTAAISPMLQVGNQFQVQGKTVLITNITYQTEEGIFGEGEMFIPLLGKTFHVNLENANLDFSGTLNNGKIKVLTNQHWLNEIGIKSIDAPDFSDRKKVKNFLNTAKNNEELPLTINYMAQFKHLKYNDLKLIVTELEYTAFEGVAKMIAVERTNEGDYLPFMNQNVQVEQEQFSFCNSNFTLKEDTKPADAQFPLTLKAYNPTLEVKSKNAEKDKDKMDNHGTYIAFDCNGFQYFHIQGEYTLPNDKVIPAKAGKKVAKATFSGRGQSLKQFILKVEIDSFKIKGQEELMFFVQDAEIDYNDSLNVTGFPNSYLKEDSVGYKNPKSYGKFKGLYIKNAGMQLPAAFSFKKGSETSPALNMKELIFETGKGFTFNLSLDRLLDIQGDVNGWGISLDSIQLIVKRNSFQNFKFGGGIKMPIVSTAKNKLVYNAQFNCDGDTTKPKAQLVLNFRDSAVYDMPMFSYSKLKFHKTTKIGITAKTVANPKAKTDPAAPKTETDYDIFADINGVFLIQIKDPEFELKIPFEGFQINKKDTVNLKTPMKAKDGTKTGGLDKMEVKAFATADTAKTKTPRRVGGFHFKLSDIAFKTEPDNLIKLSITAMVSMGDTSKGIAAKGRMSIFSKVDYGKLVSENAWEAITYEKFQMDSLALKAELGAVTIEGAIGFMRKDPVYGDGFAGGIKIVVAPPGSKGFEGKINGIFGKKTTETGSFKYFYVDGSVTFPVPIPLSAVQIYGFKGGVYYNMDCAVIRDKDGKYLSQQYVPKENSKGFLVGADIAIGAAEQFYARTELGIQFGKNWAFEKMVFNGQGLIMSGIASSYDDRKTKSAAVVTLAIVYDHTNYLLDANINVVFNKPIFKGGGTAKFQALLSDAGGKKTYWYLLIGEPAKGKSFDFMIGEENTAFKARTYVMAGNNYTLPEKLNIGEQDTVLQKFEPIFKPSATGQSKQGFAFGAHFKLPEIDNTYLVFRAKLKAIAGFDASFAKYTDVKCGGVATDIGMDGWYMKAQAYAYLDGNLSMDVNMPFAKGTYEIAKINAFAALDAELPNPTFMKGLVKGEYALLGGALKGKYAYRYIYGKKCEQVEKTTPTGIPIVADVYPKEGDEVEVYEDFKIATNFQLNETMKMEKIDNDGFNVTERYECTLDKNGAFAKVVLKGQDVEIANLVKTFEDKNYVYKISNKSLLEAKKEMQLKIKASCYKIDKNGNKDGSVYWEEKNINFKTKDKPGQVSLRIVDDQVPSANQLFWNKTNYKSPFVLLKKDGFEYLFKNDAMVDFPNGKKHLIKYEYKYRVYDSNNNLFAEGALDEKPGDKVGEVDIQKVQFKNVSGFYIPSLVTVKEKVSSKEIKMKTLANLNFVKGEFYELNLVRVPILPAEFKKDIKVTNEDKNLMASNDGNGNENSVVLASRTLTSNNTGTLPQEAQEFTLYKTFFGVSHYNNLDEKLKEITIDGRADFDFNNFDELGYKKINNYNLATQGLIKTYTNKIKGSHKSKMSYYHKEGFDQYELALLNANKSFEVKFFDKKTESYVEDKYKKQLEQTSYYIKMDGKNDNKQYSANYTGANQNSPWTAIKDGSLMDNIINAFFKGKNPGNKFLNEQERLDFKNAMSVMADIDLNNYSNVFECNARISGAGINQTSVKNINELRTIRNSVQNERTSIEVFYRQNLVYNNSFNALKTFNLQMIGATYNYGVQYKCGIFNMSTCVRSAEIKLEKIDPLDGQINNSLYDFERSPHKSHNVFLKLNNTTLRGVTFW
jgi:hypothetical protein